MSVRIIGIDCATESKRLGLALGEWDGHRVTVCRASVGGDENTNPLETLFDWISNTASTTLLAIDAPLGWPIGLRTALNGHVAGACIDVAPHDMFRRLTDVCIKRRLGKTSLDVGADKIARTAHTALAMLNELAVRLGASIPLAWMPDALPNVSAIEVYPAALLASYEIDASLYKRPESAGQDSIGSNARARLLGDVKARFPGAIGNEAKIERARDSADALDAILCVLAAGEFLAKRTIAPADDRELGIATIEGWIWAGERTTLRP